MGPSGQAAYVLVTFVSLSLVTWTLAMSIPDSGSSVATEWTGQGSGQSEREAHYWPSSRLVKRSAPKVQLCGFRLVVAVRGLCKGQVYNNIHDDHRTTRSISDECCRKSCTVTQLKKYCGGSLG